jgi:hypothetical protein
MINDPAKRGDSGSSEPREPVSPTPIKCALPLLAIVKGIYQACGLPVVITPGEAEAPELPPWAGNICEQLRVTIFKRLVELKPEGNQIQWRNFGRLMGICQRETSFLKNEWSSVAANNGAPMPLGLDKTGTPVAPPLGLLNDMQETFKDSFDDSLAQTPEHLHEFLSGLAEGYEMFLDTQGQLVGDRGRTMIYFELLSRWIEIEDMRHGHPPKTFACLYRQISAALGDPRGDRFEWFIGVCKGIGLTMGTEGRPRKSARKN